MDIAEAKSVLKVQLPTTQAALKTAYRRISRVEHPDVSKHPEAANRFLRVKEAFELLKVSPEIEDTGEQTTTDGTPLSSFGKGLEGNVNGATCDSCAGKGFTSHDALSIRDCTNCIKNFEGTWSYKCNRCEGGVFKNSSGKAVGKCFSCNGSGWFTPKNQRRSRSWWDTPYINVCKVCKGSGREPVSGETFYNKCYTCKGIGEIRIYNPVLPRGFIAG